MKTRLLILAGSHYQLPVIRAAKARGYYVITCDYLPENPGHRVADEYYNISTTDKEAVLELAERLQIDAIATISSDPAIPALAYATESLGLPGPSVKSVEILTEKHRFRALLKELGLNCPEHWVVQQPVVPSDLPGEPNRYVVKPIDSSGSKGISICSGETRALQASIRKALQASRGQKCIIESYIDGHQVHGDAYVVDGQVAYSYLGDHHLYSLTGSAIPVSTRWPSRLEETKLHEITRQVNMIVSAAGYLEGPINIEARVDDVGEVHIIEIGPRNGGNYVPIIQQKLTGFDFIEQILDRAVGITKPLQPVNSNPAVGAHYIVHADRAGRFDGLTISGPLREHLIYQNVFVDVGEEVEVFTSSSTTIGVLLLQFGSVEQRDALLDHVDRHVQVRIDSGSLQPDGGIGLEGNADV